MARRKTDKDVRELLGRVKAQGWRIEYRGD